MNRSAEKMSRVVSRPPRKRAERGGSSCSEMKRIQ